MSFTLRPYCPHRRTSGAALIGTEPRQTFAHVYGLDEGALEYEVEGAPVAVSIAPDDLHKANGSGGDPYTMEFPNADADGALVANGIGCSSSTTCGWASLAVDSRATRDRTRPRRFERLAQISGF